jgi:PIN domain nuclease of toxin-antitoxin system
LNDLAVVLDASCLLASAFGEPGGEGVRPLISGALISAVNWSEFVQKVQQRGIHTQGIRTELEGAGLRIVPVSVAQAEAAAELWPLGRPLGLSLADRLCLALGLAQPSKVYTADRAWTQLPTLPHLEVVCIRATQVLHDQTK